MRCLKTSLQAAAKTGALGSAAVVIAVAQAARSFAFPLVVDPVMVSKHGLPLLPASAVEAIRGELLRHAALVTPNVPEAEALAEMPIRGHADMRRAAARIHALGPRAVLIKGGHLEGDATDLLFDGAEYRDFPAPRVETDHGQGAGCTYSRSPNGIRVGTGRGRGARQALHRGCHPHQSGTRTGLRPCQPFRGGWMKFEELLIAAIQRAEIPLRFEPGAEESVALPVTEVLKAWVSAHLPEDAKSDFDAAAGHWRCACCPSWMAWLICRSEIVTPRSGKSRVDNRYLTIFSNDSAARRAEDVRWR